LEYVRAKCARLVPFATCTLTRDLGIVVVVVPIEVEVVLEVPPPVPPPTLTALTALSVRATTTTKATRRATATMGRGWKWLPAEGRPWAGAEVSSGIDLSLERTFRVHQLRNAAEMASPITRARKPA
jgi:hypothetical protein